MPKNFLDPTDFTDPRDAIQFSNNAIRQTMRFDVFEGRTTFTAQVLSKPVFLVDAQLSAEDDPLNVNVAEEGRLTKFAFKARIIDDPSPHEFLPNPCAISPDSDRYKKTNIMRIINLHTTFISSDDYTELPGRSMPNVGDHVTVELKPNVHSYNLQFGTFIGLSTSRPPPPRGTRGDEDPDAVVDRSAECFSAQKAFGEGLIGGEGTGAAAAGQVYIDTAGITHMPSMEIGGSDYKKCKFSDRDCLWELAKYFLTALRAEQFNRGEEGEIAGKGWATGIDHTGLKIELSKCGGKGKYTLKNCKSFTAAGATAKFHPDFGEHLVKAINAAIAAGVVKSSQITGIGGARTTQKQIYFRLAYRCGKDYNTIMTNSSKKCTTPAASPTKSNHEVGLASDISGILTSGSTEAAMKKGSVARESAFFKWLIKNVHNKSAYGNIKGWISKEPWHWSYNGG